MSSSLSFSHTDLVSLLGLVLLLLSPTIATTAATSLRGGEEMEDIFNQGQDEPDAPRQLQELQEYATRTGHLDPHIANGHLADDGGMVVVYNSLGPSHVAAMGGSFDALANPEGYGGVGPGSLAMGIVVKDVVQGGDGDDGEEGEGDGEE